MIPINRYLLLINKIVTQCKLYYKNNSGNSNFAYFKMTVHDPTTGI